ncbi:MAG: hypothetical protein PHG75_02940 [Syntrophomonas sp.]|nr:hypothetical protein [Syntrophomonas sp.]
MAAFKIASAKPESLIVNATLNDFPKLCPKSYLSPIVMQGTLCFRLKLMMESLELGAASALINRSLARLLDRLCCTAVVPDETLPARCAIPMRS